MEKRLRKIRNREGQSLVKNLLFAKESQALELELCNRENAFNVSW